MITSVDNPRVKEVLLLRKGRERRRSGLFLAEGPREVERAIAAGLVVRELYHAPELLPGWAHVDTQEVSARVLAKMAYRAAPEGVLAVVEAPRHELPRSATLVLVAVGIEKPGNLGAMARSADAAGADALLVAEAEADPWNPNAIRASTGAVFTLPILEMTSAQVRDGFVRVAAAVVSEGAIAHTAADLTPPTAIVVGSEDFGLSDEWKNIADTHVHIPMHSRTADSLNAATAAAILLFEAVRQRG